MAVRCGSEEIVLFRGKGGQVFALEDRCPHRRVPLSMGRVTPEGWLQCGYHGWCYDGSSGVCQKIPNLRSDERVPERYRAETYAICETPELVYVRIGAGSAAASTGPYSARGVKFAGTTMVTLPHDEFVAALFDGPQLLLHTTGVRLLEQNIADPAIRGDRVVMERGAAWTGPAFPDRFATEYPLTLRTTTVRRTGESVLEVLTGDEAVLMSALIAPVPAARGVTAVRWHSCVPGRTGGLRGAAIELAARLGRAPITIRPHIDAESLSKLIAGPSRAWRESVDRPSTVSAVA